MKQPKGTKLGVHVGKRGQATKNQRKRKLKKLEKVGSDLLKIMLGVTPGMPHDCSQVLSGPALSQFPLLTPTFAYF